MSSRYSLDFHVTEDGHIDTKQNKEEIKTFCDKFCQLMVDSIQEGWIVASLIKLSIAFLIQESRVIINTTVIFLTAVAKHRVINDSLYLEVLHHATMAEKRTEAFVGRTHPLKKVTNASC